jgi:predicted RecA/RadA family phage recombinase
MAEATLSTECTSHQVAASAALVAGEIVTLADGRTGIYAGLIDAASGDLSTLHTTGQFRVAAATGTTFAAGAKVYWDISADLAIGAGAREPGDLYLGTAVVAKTSGPLFVLVDLNVGRGAAVVQFTGNIAVATSTFEGGDLVVLTNTTAAGRTVTLPAALSVAGSKLTIRNTAGTNAVTITPAGSDTFPTVTVDAVGDTIVVVATATGWVELARSIA